MKLQNALDEFILDADARGHAESTICWYQQRIARLIRFLTERDISEVESVSTSDLRAFVADLRAQSTRWADHPYHPQDSDSGLSPHTIHGYVRITRRFFRWMADEGMIETNPAARLKLPHLPKEPPKAISSIDLDRLLEAAEPDPRDYAIVCFLADTGCRVGGLVGVRLSELDLDNGSAIVREKGRGGWKSRTVYFNSRTRSALLRWLEVRPESDADAVFLSKAQNGPLTTCGVYQLLKRLARKAGVEGQFNPHAFCHAWAREALRNGADLGTVSQLLGHEDETVTIRFYARWASDELRERHKMFSPLGEGEKR